MITSIPVILRSFLITCSFVVAHVCNMAHEVRLLLPFPSKLQYVISFGLVGTRSSSAGMYGFGLSTSRANEQLCPLQR